MFFTIGRYYDHTARLLGKPNCFSSKEDAVARIDEILAGQKKPHHVDYEVVEAESIRTLREKGVLV